MTKKNDKTIPISTIIQKNQYLPKSTPPPPPPPTKKQTYTQLRLTYPLSYVILIVSFFSFFFIGCDCTTATVKVSEESNDSSSVAPPKLTSTTNGFYEANANNGSFSETIIIPLPVGIDISTAHQTSGNVFGTNLQDRTVDTLVP